MSKKIKILFGAGLALVLLITGIAIPVMADDTPTPAATVKEDFLDRVAQILGGGITGEQIVEAFKAAREELKGATPSPTPGTATEKWEALLEKVAQKLRVTKEVLVSAFQQAAKEFRAKRMEDALAKAVEKGVITPEEKTQIENWYALRPAAVDKLLDLRGLMGWIRGCHIKSAINREKVQIKNQAKEQLKERVKVQAKEQIKNRLSLPRNLKPANVPLTGSTVTY